MELNPTNPPAGVEPPSYEDRVMAILDQSKDPDPEPKAPDAPATQQEVQPEGQANSEEVSPDDIPDETPKEAQPEPVDVFEIVHDGQQRKLSREETIRYAQQGFDYTQKTQALAAKDRQVSQHLQALAEAEQYHPQLMQQRARVEAAAAQLEPYRNFNWVKLANDDPMGYPAHRAQYDVLVQAYHDANAAYGQHEAAFKQHIGRVTVERMKAEEARIPELIPEWRDPQKRQAGTEQLAKHFAEQYGVPFEELNGSLKSALALSVAYKAMKYDQLLKSKAEKVKQLRTAPPVTVPGGKSGSVKADQEKELRARLRKTGSLDDAAAVLLNRMK